MKRFLLPLIAVTIAGLILPADVRPAYACSCALMPAEVRVDTADIIIIANVTELVVTPPLDPDAPDDLEHRSDFVLQVDEYLKGSGPSTVTIFEPGLSFVFSDDGEVVTGFSSCATFTQGSEGKRYILYLTGEADSLISPGLCSGSGLVDEEHLQRVRAVLAEPPDLPPTGSAPSEADSGNMFPWLATALGATALAAASVSLLRRRLTRR